MAAPDREELAYYRTVEDHFAALRGMPFLFTPKDFALLRRWYEEGVPLAAVIAGIGEAWERRRARDADPVSSLAYCRHAVTRHARRLRQAHVGAAGEAGTLDVRGALASLSAAIAAAAREWRESPTVAALLGDLERAVASLPPEGQPEVLDETLAELEFTALEALERALPTARRQAIAVAVDADLAGLDLAPEVRGRTRRALLAKAVRRTVALPRMEIGHGAH